MVIGESYIWRHYSKETHGAHQTIYIIYFQFFYCPVLAEFRPLQTRSFPECARVCVLILALVSFWELYTRCSCYSSYRSTHSETDACGSALLLWYNYCIFMKGLMNHTWPHPSLMRDFLRPQFLRRCGVGRHYFHFLKACFSDGGTRHLISPFPAGSFDDQIQLSLLATHSHRFFQQMLYSRNTR